jgi:hypothetical protein
MIFFLAGGAIRTCVEAVIKSQTNFISTDETRNDAFNIVTNKTLSKSLRKMEGSKEFAMP